MISPTEKHPWYWYRERIESIPMPNGMKKLLCPFCPFSLESRSYDRDLEVTNHIEKEHPENLEEVYEKFHRPTTKESQRTLEGFQ